MTDSTIISTWFTHPEWWFDSKHQYDYEVCQALGKFLHKMPSDALPLEKVIIYDQVARHMERITSDVKVDQFDHMALGSALDILNGPIFDELSSEQKCFAMLPLRHSGRKHLIERSQKIAAEQWKKTNNPMFRRFYAAGLKRLLPMNDAEVTESFGVLHNPIVSRNFSMLLRLGPMLMVLLLYPRLKCLIVFLSVFLLHV